MPQLLDRIKSDENSFKLCLCKRVIRRKTFPSSLIYCMQISLFLNVPNFPRLPPCIPAARFVVTTADLRLRRGGGRSRSKLLLSRPSLRGQTSFGAPKLWAEIVRHGAAVAGISSIQLPSFVFLFSERDSPVLVMPTGRLEYRRLC